MLDLVPCQRCEKPIARNAVHCPLRRNPNAQNEVPGCGNPDCGGIGRVLRLCPYKESSRSRPSTPSHTSRRRSPRESSAACPMIASAVIFALSAFTNVTFLTKKRGGCRSACFGTHAR